MPKASLSIGVKHLTEDCRVSSVSFLLDYFPFTYLPILRVAPDTVIYLTVPVSAQMNRGGWGEELYEKQAFQEKVKQAFTQIRDERWVEVNGDRTEGEVHGTIREIAIKTIERCQNSHPPILWETGV